MAQTPDILKLLNLAIQNHTSGRLPQAENLYRKVLQIEPENPDALHLLGLIAHQIGQNQPAAELMEKAIAIHPNHVDALYNLGAVYTELGNLNGAARRYQKAITLKPDHANAYNNLGGVFKRLGRAEQALESYRQAIALDPNNSLFWSGLGNCLSSMVFSEADDELINLFRQLLEHPTTQPTTVIPAILNALGQREEFNKALGQKDSVQRANELSNIPLFLAILKLCPLNSLEIERALTEVRKGLLDQAKNKVLEAPLFPLLGALAHQCFINEYLYPVTAEEEETVSALATKDKPTPVEAILLACYRPLSEFDWSGQLAEENFPPSLASVFTQQVTEPRLEAQLAQAIPMISAIGDKVSRAVQEQYEENPYPRWVKTGLADQPRPLSLILQSAPLSFDLGGAQIPNNPEILIAGCGTGQQAITTASQYAGARITAMDLSKSSLAYAKRKTQELGLTNIDYLQGDILKLEDLKRQFDVIESVGVLHHMEAPLAGWRVLVRLLRPGGLMRLGFYSQLGRKYLKAGRQLIEEKAYNSNVEDIRAFRQKVISLANTGAPEMEKISRRGDFFSTSNCRDLLFHVQEHRLTLPEIEAALKTFGLAFLGFELKNPSTGALFNQAYPGEQRSLARWHQFEQANPDTFQGMYQFWCQKT